MPRQTMVIVLAGIIAAILGLAACSSGPDPSASPTPPASVSPTPTPTPTPTAPPTPGAVIDLIVPADGATVHVPVVMSGTSNTFEAALTGDALTAVGDLLCVRHIVASSGSGTPGTWQTTLDFVPPSDSQNTPVTLRAYELSAKDGAMINLVERVVAVSPVHAVIMLSSPTCGDVVAPGANLAIAGLATVFEAALTVELRDQVGTVVFSRDLLTEEGSVESLFGTTITVPAALSAGLYDVVAFDRSARDGQIENEFTVQIAVQAAVRP
jgi:hypothetical protein